MDNLQRATKDNQRNMSHLDFPATSPELTVIIPVYNE
jgi:undecaprenyl-phosphate 4-deoxy-4-formamido-L-arabinose transferase